MLILLFWFLLSPPESRGVVYIQNSGGAIRAIPADPGGYKADDKGLAVYRLIDKKPSGFGKKEVAMTGSEDRDGAHYYTIHSEVVNIYGDESRVHTQAKERVHRVYPEAAPITGVVLDLATFFDREQAVAMVRDLSIKEPYKSIILPYMEVVREKEAEMGKCLWFRFLI